ncbi:MAG: hypothetical protein JXR84_01040 [Anaerolineae bacterium]|nr:hypothetical protein [Anaerolineae bacterium]
MRRLLGLALSMGLILIGATTALAQQGPDIKFDFISTEQGLSTALVMCIAQDRQGFMWFGTQDGLDKYDGYDITVYKHNPDDLYSLSNNFILALYVDRSGALWVGTENGGLNRLDCETGRFTRYVNDPGDPYSLSHNYVSAIYEGRSGALLYRFDPVTEQFTHYPAGPDNPYSLAHNSVWAIFEDSLDELWVGTFGGGLHRFERDSERFTRYQNNPQDPSGLADNNLTIIYEDSAGVLWVGVTSGPEAFAPYPGVAKHGHLHYFRWSSLLAILTKISVLLAQPSGGDL